MFPVVVRHGRLPVMRLRTDLGMFLSHSRELLRRLRFDVSRQSPCWPVQNSLLRPRAAGRMLEDGLGAEALLAGWISYVRPMRRDEINAKTSCKRPTRAPLPRRPAALPRSGPRSNLVRPCSPGVKCWFLAAVREVGQEVEIANPNAARWQEFDRPQIAQLL